MEEIRKTVEGTCRWTQGWLEENSVRLDAIEVSCVLLSLSALVSAAGIKQEIPERTLEPELQEPEARQEKEEPPKKKRKIDAGKIRALRKANWTVKAIADEMQCTVATVYRALGKVDAGNEAGSDDDGTA